VSIKKFSDIEFRHDPNMVGQIPIWFLIASFLFEWLTQGINLYSVFAAVYFGLFGFFAFFLARFIARNPLQYFVLSPVIFLAFSYIFAISKYHNLSLTSKSNGVYTAINGSMTWEGAYILLMDTFLPYALIFLGICLFRLWIFRKVQTGQ